MREIIYRYANRGMYYTEDRTVFGEDTQLKLVVEPHAFSLAVDGQLLRSSEFAGASVLVSCEGEALFCDREGNELAHAPKGADTYREVRLVWEQGFVSVQFGYMATVDYYPNCDGESDRWGQEWVCERMVTLDWENRSLQVE